MLAYRTTFFTSLVLHMKPSAIGLLVLLAGYPSLLFSQTHSIDYQSLPPERFPAPGWAQIEWEDPGNWTVVDVTTLGIRPGGEDVSALLSTVIDNATTPTVFYFPPGSYTFREAVDIQTDNIILRGAGTERTQFYIDGDGTHEIRFMGWDYDPVAVVADVPPGGKILSLEGVSGLRVGDLLEVSQDVPAWEADWGRRSWGQLALITDINNNQVTIDIPLSLGLSTNKQPQVTKIRAIRNVGVEDLYIERKAYGESSLIEMRSVYNGFVRNVESYNTIKFHVFLNRCRQVVVEGNYMHDAQNYGTGGHGYGVNLENLSTHILVTNNIFKNLRHHILVQTGTNHSVISYNYNVDIKELVDLSLHGHYSNHNLYEGNIVWWAGFADFWGQLGPENTLFRNQVWGKREGGEGVSVYDNSDRQNIIGNDFLRESELATDNDVDDLYEEGNRINGRIQWNALDPSAALPPSLYLDAAPNFWPGDLTWPPFGPDIAGAETNKIPAQLRYEGLLGEVPDNMPFAPGDVSGNGSITALDAALTLQHTVGEQLEGQALDAADVSGNGSVSALDASLILQYAAQLITCFPVSPGCSLPPGSITDTSL